jgi:hypothetical protein
MLSSIKHEFDSADNEEEKVKVINRLKKFLNDDGVEEFFITDDSKESSQSYEPSNFSRDFKVSIHSPTSIVDKYEKSDRILMVEEDIKSLCPGAFQIDTTSCSFCNRTFNLNKTTAYNIQSHIIDCKIRKNIAKFMNGTEEKYWNLESICRNEDYICCIICSEKKIKKRGSPNWLNNLISHYFKCAKDDDKLPENIERINKNNDKAEFNFRCKICNTQIKKYHKKHICSAFIVQKQVQINNNLNNWTRLGFTNKAVCAGTSDSTFTCANTSIVTSQTVSTKK